MCLWHLHFACHGIFFHFHILILAVFSCLYSITSTGNVLVSMERFVNGLELSHLQKTKILLYIVFLIFPAS